MRKIVKKFSGCTLLFMLVALLALLVMGSTGKLPRMSDLNSAALQLAQESNDSVSQKSLYLARHNPGAILRANVISK